MIFELLVAALCLFTPLAFGTTEAWSQEIFVAIITALVLCVVLQTAADPSVKFVGTWAYLAIILFLGLCLVQLLPLPAQIVRTVSPGTYRTKYALLADMPDVASILQRMTVTFYAAASRAQLRLVVAVSAVFVVVIHYYRTPARITRLLMTIACVGLAVALLAFYQNLSGADTVYGIVPAIQKNSGPFMCYSHFGQFMNLSLGAAFGLLLVRLLEVLKRQRYIGDVFAELREPGSWMIWLLAATCVLAPIAVFLSLTRMGMISLLLAGGFTGAMLAWRSPTVGKTSIVLVLAIVSFAGLLAAGFDAVYSRLATIRHVEIVDGGRLQMLKDMTAEFRLFPLVGAGLGTHEFVFPMFDHSHIPNIATHAENEYAQLLEECGVVGLVILGFFLGSVLLNYWKTVRRPREPIQFAAFGLGLGLLAILIHSASDFGQHVPANALLTAIFAGLLVNLAKLSQKQANKPHNVPAIPGNWFAANRLAPLGASLAAVAILTGTLWSADRSRRAESAWNRAYAVQAGLEQNAWQGTNDTYADLLVPANQAAELAPDNVTYRYWLNVFRWRAISRVTDPTTHAVLFTPKSIAYAARITEQLEDIRVLCPTFGPPLCVAGQIEHFVLHRPEGLRHIEEAFHLTPYDRTVCFIAGKLAVEGNDWDQSVEAFKRCTALGGFDNEIIDTYVDAGRPELAMQIVAGRRQELEYLAGRLQGIARYRDIADTCQNEATSLLLAEANAPGASAEVLADLAARYAQQNKPADAIQWYQKALGLNYGEVDWRLNLAGIMAATGRVSDAMEEAKICIRLRPQCDEARKMIGDLSLRSDADRDMGAAAGANLASDAALQGSPTR